MPCWRARHAISRQRIRPSLRIEARRRLVEEQHAGPVDQPHRDVELPLHAAGVGARLPVGRGGQGELLEQFADTRAEPRSVEPVELPLQCQVLAPRGVDVHAGFLRHAPDGPPDGVGLLEHVETRHASNAGIRARQRVEDLHCRGLARAVRPEQPEDAAPRHHEREAVERPHVRRIGLDQRLGLDGEAARR